MTELRKDPDAATRTLDRDGAAILAQRRYYGATADRYDDWHTAGEDEHRVALRHAAAYLQRMSARSVLDTGCGTGRAMRFLADSVPGLQVHGNDPSAELLEVAHARHGIPRAALTCSTSDALPFGDGAFDAVIETGVLHHVPRPDAIVAEMLRVARLAVFISDSNMYGHGSLLSRLVKLGLRRLGLLTSVNRLRRGGHSWYYSERDGIAWSYSVFDSRAALRAACDSVLVLPTAPDTAAAMPLLESSHCLLCGFKLALPERAAPLPHARGASSE